MSTAESSVNLLSSVIKQLSSSGDSKHRQQEKEKLQADLKNANEKLNELVEDNQEHLKGTVQSFGSVVTRIAASRERVKQLHEKLAVCRTLLYCNRNDLKTYWQEGLECTEKLNLLDKIEKAVAVPEQLDRFMSRKYFLHAAHIIEETMDDLERNLSNVDALRDLRASLQARKVVLFESIVDEINKQIHSETSKNSNISDTNTSSFKRSSSQKHAHLESKMEEIPVFNLGELKEDLQVDPEQNVPLFLNLLVCSLLRLNKIPDGIDLLKERIKRDMMTVLRRASDEVAKQAIDSGIVVAVEELAVKTDPHLLLKMLEVSFEKFRRVAWNYHVLLVALKQLENGNGLNLYTMDDIWSKVQYAIQDLLHPYLDIQNLSTPQQTFSKFGSINSTVTSFFTTKRRLPIATNLKPKSGTLFKFECSSSAEAIHSYLREQDIASALPEDTYTDFVVWSTPQLLCKPQANNITAVFTPVNEFIKEIDKKTSSNLASAGVLKHFVTDFVQKVFLHELLYEVSEKESIVTKGHDALRNLCDNSAMKRMSLAKPLLKGSIVVYEIMQELLTLMEKLPDYSQEILEILIKTLTVYFDSCNTEYKRLVYSEDEGKTSKIISVNWVRDDDISRLLMSLPHWINLNGDIKVVEEEEDFEATKKRQDREASLLISNLERVEIDRNQVMLDTQDLKSIANLQESLEWLAEKIESFKIGHVKISSSVLESDLTDSITDIALKMKQLSQSCLLLLHLEVRCHCFYFIGKATRESSFVCTVDSIEVDPQIPQLVKDLRDIEDLCSTVLSPAKLRYLFDGLGYLMAAIIIASTSYIKKINRNGVKKMCQNIFTIQQELANITARRDLNLDFARQYFELLYLTPDKILNMIIEQGSFCKEQDYSNALELLSRSEVPHNKNLWIIRRNKLREILKQMEEKQDKTP